jgi:hypothetical protein
MRRFFTLVCLLCLALPAGISISGCYRNPAGNYCNGSGYGLKDTDVASISLQPQAQGISLAYGQTQQVQAPTAKTCLGSSASVSSYTYGTTNNLLVDISPTGNICAGTWNRNSGGGIADYTICNFPKPLPSTGGQPYGVAYITATADAVTSNPVEVYIHAQVTSISLVGPTQCLSQGVLAQLDAQACYTTTNSQGQPASVLMCAPSSVTTSASPSLACPLPAGQTLASIPSCTNAIGTLSYTVGISTIASINPLTNQITAEQPGTTAITAAVAGSGSSAGYFTTCPPASIQVTLNSQSTGPVTVSQGVTQNLTTTVTDTNGVAITGLTLDYQSTNPVDISAGTAGAITASFPGEASIYAICQPSTCNPSPINEVGLYGTGLSISSNPILINTPGTASAYFWLSAPGYSQYFIPIELLTGTLGSTVRLPYVPNSMKMDQLGTNLYFGSSHELMVFSTANNSVAKTDTSVPGVVLAVAPNNQTILINDPVRQVFYIYSESGGISATFGGLGSAAAWTPDSKTLYVTDSASLNNPAAGVIGHRDTLYVYNLNTGWTTYPLNSSGGAENLAITVPGVGAYLSGNPTVDHTWCPSGTVGNYASMSFYPEADSVPVQTGALAATTDGKHILGAMLSNSGATTLTDIGVSIPNTKCTVTTSGPASNPVQTLTPLSTNPTLLTPQPLPVNVNAVAENGAPAGGLQVVPSPASNLAFITYNGTTPGALLPYYIPGSGKVNYVTLMNGSSASTTETAPLAGSFSPDDTLFFVSTAGDNLIHYINVKTLTDTQQIAPNLPACTPVDDGGNDPGCLLTAPTTNPVPATAIAVKPRSTT